MIWTKRVYWPRNARYSAWAWPMARWRDIELLIHKRYGATFHAICSREFLESLPVVYLNNPCVPMLTRWRFSDAERAQIAAGADLVLTQLTFGEPFRPVHLQVSMPDEHPILLGE